MPTYSTPLENIFQALANPTRRAVVQRLAAGPAPVSVLASPFGMALPSFLQHLDVLETSGLVRSRRSGRTRVCELDPARLAEAEGWLAAQRRLWELRLDRLDDYLKTMEDPSS